MEYSYYRLEDINESIASYQEICDLFINLTNNNNIKNIMSEILYNGGYNGFSISSKLSNRDNPLIEGQRRLAIAYLLLTNPDTFVNLMENKINLFHGTNANALPSILKYGLNSAEASEKLGIKVTTGEGGKVRNFVSLTDCLNIAADYSSFEAQNPNEELSFKVIVGTTSDDALSAGIKRVSSDIPEVGIRNSLPLENIKVLCVPSSKVSFVEKLTNGTDIKVLPMDETDKRFYYIDEVGYVSIDEELLEKFRNKEMSKDKTFTKEEIKDLSKTRLISKIKNKLEEIKQIMERGHSKNDTYKHR